jgi:hypothetical protein
MQYCGKEESRVATYQESGGKLPVREFDVVIAGGGTAGVVAALAAARQGAKTAVVESKGYFGGTAVEGGVTLHSYFNLWKAFPGVEKKQVVRGIPQEIIDRLARVGGTSGHAEVEVGFDYDSVSTSIDTELYKLVAHEMLAEAGVTTLLNTFAAGAVREGSAVKGVIVESHQGREMLRAKSFVDCTGYGDLSAQAGARFTEPNDHHVAGSMGVGNVDIEKLTAYLQQNNALTDLVYGRRSGKDNQIVRIGLKNRAIMPPQVVEAMSRLNVAFVTTTVHDNYFMFVRVNFKLAVSPTNRDEMAKAELDIRRRQYESVKLMNRLVPGCEHAFIARTSPSISIRRARLIECDYDVSLSDVVDGRHFDDEVMTYGFHDSAPRIQIKNGGNYGTPYRALRVKGIDNLLAAGMLITSDHEAHMSTRNTVSCMAQGQAAGTAAALCAKKDLGSRDLPYADLRAALEKGGVYFEKK